MRRAAIATGTLVVGAVTGGALGAGWFRISGSDAEMLGGITAAFQGGVAGALAAGSWGWSFPEWRRVSPLSRATVVAAWLGCGVLLMVGVVYIGGWTNADGPDTEAMIGILAIPASLIGVGMVARFLRRRTTAVPRQPG